MELFIIIGVLVLLAVLAIIQDKEGEEDDKRTGQNLEGFLNAINDFKREAIDDLRRKE